MARYAENTEVSSDRSRNEIERTLSRYGASGFMYGWSVDHAVIAFEAHCRKVKFVLPLPDRKAREFWTTDTGRARKSTQAEKAYEQAVRQRWRALSLVIKAKLEAVEAGISVFEEEFLAHILMPDGQTVGQHVLPRVTEAYGSGKSLPLLPHLQ